MKALVTDRAALSSVSPASLKDYLTTKGWAERLSISQDIKLWKRSKAEIIVLERSDFEDYPLRISEALNCLEKLESRSQLQIIRDIYTSSYDVIRIRNKSQHVHDGSIPYDQGLEFNAGAKELIQSVACSVADPKPHYLTRKPQRSQEFMKKLRLGQTEQGSYILTILNPVLALQPGEQCELLSIPPYERKVTTMLSVALTKANAAAISYRDTGDYSEFFDGIKHGISANFLDSISRISATSPNQDIDFKISWSRNRPAPNNIDTEISISTNTVQVFTNASSILKEREAEKEYNMRGVVIRLQKEKYSKTGKATVLDISSGAPRKITIELTEQQYQLAIDAHKKYKVIQCIGEISKRGRTYTLINQGNLNILEELEISDENP